MSEFVVDWQDPADAQRSWRIDRIHHPDPIAPLDYWIFGGIVAQGIEHAGREYGRPTKFKTGRFNTYMYISPEPTGPPEPTGAARLATATLDVERLWAEEIYPEVQSHLNWWAARDPAGLSNDELIAHLEETVERGRRVWQLHFITTNPTFSAIGEFADLYLELCGGTDLDAFRCIQGFGNKSVEAGRELWRLARAAATAPDVGRALGNETTPAVLDALEQTDDGRAWLIELRAFLNEYGRRSDSFGIEGLSWVEDPSSALDSIRRFVPVTEDPYANLGRLAAEREQAVAAARERAAAATDDQREHFERLLTAAQAAIVITEDHGFYIDFASRWAMRLVFVEAGRRLADASVLDHPGDVAMLHYDEIIESIRDLPALDRREMVRARRADMERWSAVHPPEFIGAPQMTPPDDDPRSRFVRRFYGPANAGLADGVLRGAAGAPGCAKGTARLILDLGSADKLEPGDVLVTRTTSPAWTPLFAVASAVVTDGGGALSHCAIVAREYGIPAVVGTISGTQTITDGQTIEVDGNEGVVRVISSTA